MWIKSRCTWPWLAAIMQVARSWAAPRYWSIRFCPNMLCPRGRFKRTAHCPPMYYPCRAGLACRRVCMCVRPYTCNVPPPIEAVYRTSRDATKLPLNIEWVEVRLGPVRVLFSSCVAPLLGSRHPIVVKQVLEPHPGSIAKSLNPDCRDGATYKARPRSVMLD